MTMSNNDLRKTAEYKDYYAENNNDKLALAYAAGNVVDTSITLKKRDGDKVAFKKPTQNSYHQAKLEGFYDCDELDHTQSKRQFIRNNYSA